MSLEQLVDEIRQRYHNEVERERQRVEKERELIDAERDRRIKLVRNESERRTTAEIAKERTQRLAGARLQARKFVYEAKERETGNALTEMRRLLENYARGKEYQTVLKWMYATAVDELGSRIKVIGRREDAALLESIAGKAFSKSPAPILGGLVAQSVDGDRRLDLSFDELLRLREDKLRALLSA